MSDTEKIDEVLRLFRGRIKAHIEVGKRNRWHPGELEQVEREDEMLAKQAILQWVADEVVRQDSDPDDASTDKAYMHMVGANIIRKHQRSVLKQNGWQERKRKEVM